MTALPRLLAIAAALLLAGPSAVAERVRVELAPRVDMDAAGMALRRALNAFEANPTALSPSWTPVSIQPGAPLELGPGLFLLLPDPVPSPPVLSLLLPDGSVTTATLATGKESSLGSIRVLPTAMPRGARIEAMVRSTADATPLLAEDATARSSATKIRGTETGTSRFLEIEAPDTRTALFAQRFVESFNRGATAEEAARDARASASSLWRGAAASADPPRGSEYRDPVNMRLAADADAPLSAYVTLTMVRGDTGAIRELTNSWSYSNQAPWNTSPRVGVESGAGGTRVDIGGPGDAFQARIRALQAERRLSVDSQSSLLVPLNGSSNIRIQGARGILDARIGARPRGREHIELLIDQTGGDWGFLGAVASRVRVRDGGTVPIASNTSTRTESSSSGPPLVGGIPYLGPALGNSRRTEEHSSFALFATATLQ